MPISGAIEEVKFMSQSQSMDSIRLANLVQTTEVMNDIEDDASLYSGNAWLGSFQFPESFGFGEEAIHERLRIPVLGAVPKAVVTGLCSAGSEGCPLREKCGNTVRKNTPG